MRRVDLAHAHGTTARWYAGCRCTYCNNALYRWRNRQAGPGETACSYPGCGVIAMKKSGLCNSHRKQQARGVELRPVRRSIRNRGRVCSVGGCMQPATHAGLCGSHYYQKRMGYDFMPVISGERNVRRDQVEAYRDVALGRRKCGQCGETKRLDRFSRNNQNPTDKPSGWKATCKRCQAWNGNLKRQEPLSREQFDLMRDYAEYRRGLFELGLLPCNECGEVMPTTEFPQRKRAHGTHLDGSKPSHYQSFCKACQTVLREKRRLARPAIVYFTEWRERGCRVCGLSHAPSVEAHHVDPRTKSFTVASFLSKHDARDEEEELRLVTAELEKCIPLCSNHHRAVTSANRNGWRRWRLEEVLEELRGLHREWLEEQLAAVAP